MSEAYVAGFEDGLKYGRAEMLEELKREREMVAYLTRVLADVAARGRDTTYSGST